MGTGGNNVPYLVNQDRFFTLKECLKIQGFPESFKLTKSYSHALMQIGNSVSVPVVKHLAKRIEEFI
jgi:DNA (cytosine-5)-methyltransferase 1